MKLKNVTFCFIVIFSLISFSATLNAEEYKVGVMLWKTAGSYDEGMKGLQKGLSESRLSIDQELINANGSKEKAVEIFQGFVKAKKDLIIAFGSHGSKLAFEQVKEIPVVVLGGNTPLALGIVKDLKNPGGNITGSSYFIDPKKQLKYFKMVFPELKTLGILYNPENGASLAEVPATKIYCQEMQINLIEKIVNRELIEGKLELYDSFVKKLPLATKSIVSKKVDAVLIPTNSEISDNMEYVLKITDPSKIPVFAYAEKGVENGALAGLTSDNVKLGYETAKIIVRILKDKESPVNIPFIFDEFPRMIINLKAAKKIEYEVPFSVVAAADKVIK